MVNGLALHRHRRRHPPPSPPELPAFRARGVSARPRS
jgi:hypothetical protein